jgi:uncharacterized damage-inducible protein DinB
MANIYDTGRRAAVADERTTLETFLDYYRNAVKNKVRDLSDADAQRRLVPSATTLAGIIKHLHRVEASWFQYRLAQLPAEQIPALRWIRDGAEGDFELEPGETVERLIAGYDQQCDQSRQTAAEFPLDHVVPHDHLGEVSLRWIYVHMIEETARHAGHADILREQIDGATGD